MASGRCLVALLLALAAPGLASRVGLRPGAASLAALGSEAASAREALEQQIQQLRAANPLFSEESCSTMYDTKLKLGGPVPPESFVKGCTEVCERAHKIYKYWGSGEMAKYACGIATKFGCVLDTLPPRKIC
uniref:Uncharacterized protein n=1 Tax=Alexandrium monilatum TaxID=311494 RepID=A0A7S4QA75_9DINO|mmetsp:Transcript_94306/g.281416  ORF Transcript_94306/g.281416 Transcript_94306/m.281416 type:complete len:132 (+) Transcript_94306:29-424(+)